MDTLPPRPELELPARVQVAAPAAWRPSIGLLVLAIGVSLVVGGVTGFVLGAASAKGLRVPAGLGGKPPRKHYERTGGYSFDPPPGWQVVDFPGLKYRICHGPRANDFAPNINVVDERFAGTLSAYVEANIKNMNGAFLDMKVRQREDFTTQDGVPAVRMITENTQRGLKLRQTFYFLGPTDRKYVITCTALAEGGEALDAAFAESVATFRMH